MIPSLTHVVLTHPHTHAGQTFGPGDRIEVTASTADWLLAHGIAYPDAGSPKAESEPKPVHRKEPKR